MEAPLYDLSRAESRVEFGMAEAEIAQRSQWRAAAAVYRAVESTMREAARHPEVFLPLATINKTDAVEFAERAAAADLAVRLNLAEATVRSHATVAAALRERLPLMWAWFGEGEVSTANARESASLVADLPSSVWSAFDAALVEARLLAPSRFRTRARALRERLHPSTLDERLLAASTARGVWSELERDGMGWLHAHLPASSLTLAMARIDGLALDHLAETDETRTMAQLRADTLSDLLVGEIGTDVVVSVALTIPALSLLGGAGTAVLDGAGPIDAATARSLVGTATAFTRVLTDPIDSAILDLDRRQYRPTAALKRWLALRDVTCTFPGCGRAASRCDLDHTTAWAEGGVTSAGNLAHLCRKHHVMKHETKWKVDRPPGSQPVWTSPTGHIRAADPPPF